jgi:Protein of unknown function (DUF2771)
VLAVLWCGLLLTACEAPRPDVTFYGNRAAVNTAPTRWCEVDDTAQFVSCTETPADQLPRLTLRPGDSVQINVPSAVGDSPWAAYVRYLDEDGELADGRTEIFTDGRLAYTVHPPSERDQLVAVEVRSDFVLTPGEQGAVDFAAKHSWLLLIDPAGKGTDSAAG